ncbi:hypothetical protein FRX31_025036 [Thalictrum thalictroides]|uniref:Uncharacterized protein n=1 Tax=Thalictrum thalictroides TaxID=46969 RepID=A0A7J6VM16_THATH|nr:hypothetical protein FRX31_025036 [Thalictrum thalictroides]
MMIYSSYVKRSSRKKKCIGWGQQEKVIENKLTRQQQKGMIHGQQQGSLTKVNAHTGQRVIPKVTMQRAKVPGEVGNRLEQRGIDVGLRTEQWREKPRMTSWSGQRGSNCGDMPSHGLKQQAEEPGVQ